MTIVINLGLDGGRIGGIFITGIFGNFYTKRGGFLTFKTGIPGGLARRVWTKFEIIQYRLRAYNI